MKIKPTDFNDLFVLEYDTFKDNRGEFVKTMHKETFETNKLNFHFFESFYSISKKNVFRGMHFQFSPHDHDKLVYVVKGAIIDVVLDLRFKSPTFGKHFSIELTELNKKGIYIGKGFAHGFLSLENDTIVEYHTTTVQNKESEGGVKWDSFGCKLPINDPIVSQRDESFHPFNEKLKYF
jgi:dTDP-4-dehydrorhamnose 3,5-epimerase/CDP-3, 6-dideoxy-D-glycero-D-glycero-4-hexulose-5-epimerase